MGWVHSRIASALLLPDYGDLWRWATSVSADGSLTAAEAFEEVEILGHSSVLSIWAAHISASSFGYEFMWLIGAFGLVIGAVVIGLMAKDALGEVSLQAGGLMAAGVGLASARFDVRGITANSLLLFEQLYYAWSYMSAFLVLRLVARSAQGETTFVGFARTNLATLVWLLALLTVADAPGSVLVIVIVTYAIAVTVFRSGLTRGMQWAGLMALLSVMLRWFVRVVTGTGVNRSTGSASDSVKLDTLVEALKLLGSAFVNLDPVVDSADRQDSIHLILGIVFVSAASVAVIGLYRVAALSGRREVEPDPGQRPNLLAGTALLAGYAVVSALSIAAARDLTANYHLSRFVRSTALTVPASVLVIVALVALSPKLTNPRLAAGLACATLMILVSGIRFTASTTLPAQLSAVERLKTSAVQSLCDEDPTPGAWTRFWRPLGDAGRINTVLDSDLFPRAREQCEPER